MLGRRHFISVALASLVSLGTISQLRADEKPALTIFAASSLKGPLDAAAKMFETTTGTKVVISFAASSALAKQIEAAAPADVFVSADLKWMGYLADKGQVDKAKVVNLLGNSLVLVAPAISTLSLEIKPQFGLADALGPDGRLAMGEVKSVPAGIYGKQALESLGVWASVENRIAGAESVKAALTLVTRGEAPLGIVYKTDALATKDVKLIAEFPDDSHAPIIYPVAPIVGSTNPMTDTFITFLQGKDAKAIFKAAGFITLD